MLRILGYIIRFILFISIPFVVLMRGAIWLHKEYHAFPWFSIAFGALVMSVVLFVYFSFIWGRITGSVGKPGWVKRRMWFVIIIAMAYVMQSVLFLSASNAKTGEVKREYSSLHPILRMSISTFLLLDKSLLITDANRQPEDYAKMGLATKSYSLHYQQSSGYAHAIDVRTNGKSEIRNFLMKTYFSMMGFNTLRHDGTADHLHISLYSKDRPGGI